MGKSTYLGPVPPDDPMFGGVELFTKSTTTPSQENTCDSSLSRTIRINWEGTDVEIDMDEQTWREVESGQPVTLEELDEEDELVYRWLFNSEPGHSLIVDFGDPNHLRWLGQISDATITNSSEY